MNITEATIDGVKCSITPRHKDPTCDLCKNTSGVAPSTSCRLFAKEVKEKGVSTRVVLCFGCIDIISKFKELLHQGFTR